MTIRIIVASLVAALASCITAGLAAADEEAQYNNQVFFRGAYSALTTNRGGEIFTDTLATGNANSSRGGWSMAAGLDLSMMEMEDMGGARVMGEIFAEFSQFSDQNVVNAAQALLGTTVVRQVNVTSLNVTIAPKVRFDDLGSGRIRPFVVPVGLAFLVNSPPSNTTSYLDLGMQFGAGVDGLVVDRISVGADLRYNHSFTQSQTNNSYWSTGVYAGINF